MALIFPGRTKCKICRDVVTTEDRIRGFPHFIPPDHPLGRFSDASVHERCFAEFPQRAELLEMLAAWRAQNLVRSTKRGAAQHAAFERALRVLDGVEPAPPLEERDHKGLALVIPLTDASRVDATGAGVTASHSESPRGTMMFVESLPAALGELMHRAGLDRVSQSVVCSLPQGRFLSGDQPERTMWIFREEGRVRLYFADATKVAPPPNPIEPVDPARWPVPEILPPTPRAPVSPMFVGRSAACPHCKAAASKWRHLSSGHFVCAACGRSFVETALEPTQ